MSGAIAYSIVVLTYARDEILAQVLERLRGFVGQREDVELIVVDNNPPDPARARLLEGFAHARLIGDGSNKGVVARNDGFDAARGDILVALDDDVFVETPDFLDRFGALFAADARLGAVTIRKNVRGETRRRVDLIPHTDKSVDLTKPFQTFRFVGGCVAFRAACLARVGGFLPDFFYGLEEIELSYRIINGGWRIAYEPDSAAEELEHPAGRKPKREVQTDRLANKYIISFLHMPAPYIYLNYLLFTPYLLIFAGGDVSVLGAIGQFWRWSRKKDRPQRCPISAEAQRYIRRCGGALWR
jgi:GT2 family glycosyltransferase